MTTFVKQTAPKTILAEPRTLLALIPLLPARLRARLLLEQIALLLLAARCIMVLETARQRQLPLVLPAQVHLPKAVLELLSTLDEAMASRWLLLDYLPASSWWYRQTLHFVSALFHFSCTRMVAPWESLVACLFSVGQSLLFVDEIAFWARLFSMSCQTPSSR